MAAEIKSDAFLGCCLNLTGGDADVSLGAVVRLANRWQKQNDRHFGISQHDFEGVLVALTRQPLETTRLREVVPRILSFASAYFNDEGEHWCPDSSMEPQLTYGTLEDFAASQDSKTKRSTLRELFETHASKLPAYVLSTLRRLDLGEPLLEACSRRGSSS